MKNVDISKFAIATPSHLEGLLHKGESLLDYAGGHLHDGVSQEWWLGAFENEVMYFNFSTNEEGCWERDPDDQFYGVVFMKDGQFDWRPSGNAIPGGSRLLESEEDVVLWECPRTGSITTGTATAPKGGGIPNPHLTPQLEQKIEINKRLYSRPGIKVRGPQW